jgi:hypothetical protein
MNARHVRRPLALLAGVLLSGGCGTEEVEEPMVAETEALAAVHEAGRLGEHGGPQGAGPIMGPLPGLGVGEGFQCDSTPEVTNLELCGRTLPGTLHLEWTGCTLQPPPGMPPPPDGASAPVSDGTIDVAHTVTLESGAECAAEALYRFAHTRAFSTSRTDPRGGSSSVQGTLTTTSVHGLEATQFTATETLDVLRRMQRPDGQAHEVRLQGTQEVAVDTVAHTRTVSGSLAVTGPEDRSASLELSGVRHVPPPECRWPVAGSVRRVESDGSSHTLEYGPECGTARLDGQPVQLRGTPGPGGHGQHPRP